MKIASKADIYHAGEEAHGSLHGGTEDEGLDTFLVATYVEQCMCLSHAGSLSSTDANNCLVPQYACVLPSP